MKSARIARFLLFPANSQFLLIFPFHDTARERSAMALLKLIAEVTTEIAYEIIQGLTEPVRRDTGSTLAVSGVSAEYGPIYVVIPPIGNSLLLPFAIQASSS
jgi:hypothetical protein